MFKLYKEHPEFDEFTRFDTETGKLATITENEFNGFLPENFEEKSTDPIQRIETADATIFTGKISSTHTRFPRRIYFQVTRNCNLECPTCFIKAQKNGSHIPLNTAIKIAEFTGKNGLMEVRLTGGEPTSHPDLIKIIHAFKDAGVYVSVATNGLIKRKVLESLSEENALWIICSIDGTPTTHNLYRNNSFDTIYKNLIFLKQKNPLIRLRITTVLTKDNNDQISEIVGIAKSLDSESITIIPLRPQVRNGIMKKKMVTAIEFKKVIDDLIDAGEKYNIKVTTTIETDYKDKIYNDPVFRKKSSCAAGREGTNLDYDSRKKELVLYGCSYSPAVDFDADTRLKKIFVAGSFSENDIETFLDIWKTDQLWSIYRDLSLKSHECEDCSYYNNHQCSGSCPIQNIDYSSIMLSEDMIDQLKFDLKKTSEWYCYKRIFDNSQ